MIDFKFMKNSIIIIPKNVWSSKKFGFKKGVLKVELVSYAGHRRVRHTSRVLLALGIKNVKGIKAHK